MKEIAVIGHFAAGLDCLDGQTVKTRNLEQALCSHFSENEILIVDTHGWANNPVQFAWSVWQTAKQCKNVVMLPAHNGLRIITPLLSVAKRFYKKCKLHYIVIGGWLPEKLKTNPQLSEKLRHFAGVYVETQTMKKALEEQGFTNVSVLPNFKNLNPLKPCELVYAQQEPHKLCTFSRVMREKGIEDAVDAVEAVNEQMGRVVYELDIYGPVDPSQTDWFASLRQRFPEYVRYKGTIPCDQSVQTLKDYFALLFPTKFYTEGIPGTIIDAYAAGLPVISAKWESFSDVIEDGQTGYGYEFGNNEALRNLLVQFFQTPEMLIGMKAYCLEEANKYRPEEVLKIIISKIEGEQ